MKKLSENQIQKMASVFSITSLAVCFVAGVIILFWPNNVVDTIGVVAFTTFFLPFLVTQVTFTAGVFGPFIGSSNVPKVMKVIFYVLCFPFINMFFFSCISVLFNIYPLREKINGVLVRNDYRLESWLCIASIYATLIIIGLIWRHFRNKKLSLA